MDKWQVARALDEIGRYLELGEGNQFKALAFEKAARKVETLEEDLPSLVRSGGIYKLAGIGKATGAVIEELASSGSSAYLDELRASYPPGIFELLRVPGLGLKKIGVLHSKLGIGSLDALEAAATANQLSAIPGFGSKTQQKILAGIAFARKGDAQFLLPVGLAVAEATLSRILEIGEVQNAVIAGSIRRRLEVIRNVNIVIATTDPAAVIEAIGERSLVAGLEKVDEQTIRGVSREEMEVLFHLCTPSDFGAAVLRTTGSEEFLEAFAGRAKEAGFNLQDGSLYKGRKTIDEPTEEGLFERCGLAFVEPERREDGDDLRTKRKRVALVERTDLRGTFHVHTTWSDGRNSVSEMLAAGAASELEYIGLSDHSKVAFYAGGLTEEQVTQQQAEIARERKKFPALRVFRGTEADILPDGSIDYGKATLDKFDFVVASIHSRFTMDKDEMTERILLALDDPHVTFLGHLTGRKLLSREGYTMDFDKVFQRAGERGVMIEINGNPNRLDLDWRRIQRARSFGVFFSIHPDAHSIREYHALLSGTWVARKGGLSAQEIFNTQPADAVADYLDARRARAKKG